MGQAGGAEAGLGVGITATFLTQDGRVGHAAAFQQHFTMAAQSVIEAADAALYGQPRVVRLHEENGGGRARRLLRIVMSHHQIYAGALGTGGPPFMTVDHPLVALPTGPRLYHQRVGAGAGRRLGHEKGGVHVAFGQWAQVAFLLRFRAQEVEKVHVAFVRGSAVEDQRAKQATPGCLKDGNHLFYVEAQSTILRRQLRAVDPGCFGPGPQRLQTLLREFTIGAQLALGRNHNVLDEVEYFPGEGLDHFRITEHRVRGVHKFLLR